jgi:hypothetical protein
MRHKLVPGKAQQAGLDYYGGTKEMHGSEPEA